MGPGLKVRSVNGEHERGATWAASRGVPGCQGLINNVWYRRVPAEAPVFHGNAAPVNAPPVRSRPPQTGLLFHISGTVYGEFQMNRSHLGGGGDLGLVPRVLLSWMNRFVLM